MATQETLNRLRWHCRRGMLELDVLLGPFVDSTFSDLNDNDQALFTQLLECEDADLFSWFIDREPSQDAELQRMVECVLAFARKH